MFTNSQTEKEAKSDSQFIDIDEDDEDDREIETDKDASINEEDEDPERQEKLAQFEGRIAELESEIAKLKAGKPSLIFARLTPREVSTIFRVGEKKVRDAIRNGELAIYPAPGKGGRIVQWILPKDAAKFFGIPLVE